MQTNRLKCSYNNHIGDKEARLSSEEESFYKKTSLSMEKLVVILVLMLGTLLMLKSAQAGNCQEKKNQEGYVYIAQIQIPSQFAGGKEYYRRSGYFRR